MKILMVASFGGHFIQLRRLYKQMLNEELCENVEIIFAVTEENVKVDGRQVLFFTDVHRGSGIQKIFGAIAKSYNILKKSNPDVVISTGALPGLIMCFAAKLLFKKVIWLDSMANYQKLSFSGRLARLFCDVCLTQWEHLAENDKRVSYWGKVL